MDDLVKSIGELAKARDQLARQAEQQYVVETEDVLRSQCRDPNRIERLLDGILEPHQRPQGNPSAIGKKGLTLREGLCDIESI